MAEAISPVLKKFDERLASRDGTRDFPNQDKETTHAEQRAVLTPWSLGCASENLETDYNNFIRYSFGDAWEAGTVPFTQTEYVAYLKMVERDSGVSLLWTDGACRMKKTGAEYLIIVDGGDGGGKTTSVGESSASSKTSGGADKEKTVPTGIEIIDDDEEVINSLFETMDNFSAESEEQRLGFTEGLLRQIEDHESVIIKFMCGDREYNYMTTESELQTTLDELSCD